MKSKNAAPPNAPVQDAAEGAAKEAQGQAGHPSLKSGDPRLVFALEAAFANAKAILTASRGSVDEAKKHAVVVLDTNALLMPYMTSSQTLTQIESTYQKLAKEQRLRVPARVAREFARNRATKIAELFQQINRRSQVKVKQGTWPLLSVVQKYQEFERLEDKIEKLLVQYRKIATGILEQIRSWDWDDPVTQLYRRVFSPETVVQPQETDGEIQKQLYERYAQCRPPGYKDQSKPDDGIGDFAIWLSILEIGRKEKKDVLFVTGEEKPDWWVRSEGRPLYPRYELVHEFQQVSDDHSFHIVKLSQVLEWFGATNESVQEVKKEEAAEAEAARAPRVESIGLSSAELPAALAAARARVVDAQARLAALPADAANYNVALPLGRAWHFAMANLSEAMREVERLEARLANTTPRKDPFTGIWCHRCKQPTLGSGGGSNVCGVCYWVDGSD